MGHEKTKIKLYRHNRMIQANTTVTVKEEVIPIAFQNGTKYPQVVKGYYVTDNPDIQKALEALGGYKKDFILEQVNGKYLNEDDDEDIPVIEKLRADLVKANEATQEAVEKYDSEAVLVEKLKLKIISKDEMITDLENQLTEIKSAQEAQLDSADSGNSSKDTPQVTEFNSLQEVRDILKAEPFNISGQSLNSEKAIENKAAELGYKYTIKA